MDFMLAGNPTMVALLVFLAAGTGAFGIMALVRAQGSVKRRAAGIGKLVDSEPAGGSRSLRHSSLKAAQRVIEYTTKHYAGESKAEVKVLRRRMIQAGIYEPRAVAYFFLGRTALAIGLAAMTFAFAQTAEGSSVLWMLVGAAGMAGYVAPSMYIDRRIKARKAEHQSGFPDFMDLLVVCADAGLIGITAASLIWLAGCETTSSLNPFKFASTDATNSQAKSETEPEITGTVPPPVGDPPARPELLGADPNDDVSLAKSYFRQGSYGLAERHFRKAVELHPKQLEAWVGLAASYDRLRRFDLADRAYTQAIRLGGATPEILNNQGFSYMLRGDFGRARTTLLAAQAKDPASPYIQNNLRLLEQAVRKKKMVN